MNFSQALAKIKENEEIRAKSTPIAMVAPELKQYTEDTEITKTCAVLGCEEFKNLNSDSFFRFPEDSSFRQIWTDLTGRNNWTPTDYSYICVQHFSVDCFECDAHNAVVLNSKAVPSLKLPKHVLEVEYIDEETFDNEYEDDFDDNGDQDYEMDSEAENNMEYEEHLEEHLEDDNISEEYKITSIHPQQNQLLPQQQNQLQHQHQNKLQHQQQNKLAKQSISCNKQLANGTSNNALEKLEKPSTSHIINKKVELSNKIKEQENLELLKLFTEVQTMQRQAISLKMKLRNGMRVFKRQKRCLARLKEEIDIKKNILVQRQRKKTRILLSLQDKIKEDTNGLVLAMPTRHTDDLKNFALSIYKYSPQAYIYIRNTLRTLLPSTDVLDSWLLSGYEPRNVMTSSNMVRIASELTDTELSCKVSLR